MTKKAAGFEVTEGSGNVFADLGLPDSEELLAKARLASAISDIIESRGLTQAEAAELMGTTQPKVSNLINGRLEGFSFERLARFLNSLGRDVEIVVESRSTPRKRGRLVVTLGKSS
jgi:predicted XRE-type DNA-binding protein